MERHGLMLPGPSRGMVEHDGPTLEQDRRTNDSRLKSAFEDIFTKYEQDFTDVGDEVDLVTGEIIVNNGHISQMRDEGDVGSGRAHEFIQSFAAEMDDEDSSAEGNDDDDDDYGDDEGEDEDSEEQREYLGAAQSQQIGADQFSRAPSYLKDDDSDDCRADGVHNVDPWAAENDPLFSLSMSESQKVWNDFPKINFRRQRPTHREYLVTAEDYQQALDQFSSSIARQMADFMGQYMGTGLSQSRLQATKSTIDQILAQNLLNHPSSVKKNAGQDSRTTAGTSQLYPTHTCFPDPHTEPPSPTTLVGDIASCLRRLGPAIPNRSALGEGPNEASSSKSVGPKFRIPGAIPTPWPEQATCDDPKQQLDHNSNAGAQQAISSDYLNQPRPQFLSRTIRIPEPAPIYFGDSHKRKRSEHVPQHRAQGIPSLWAVTDDEGSDDDENWDSGDDRVRIRRKLQPFFRPDSHKANVSAGTAPRIDLTHSKPILGPSPGLPVPQITSESFILEGASVSPALSGSKSSDIAHPIQEPSHPGPIAQTTPTDSEVPLAHLEPCPALPSPPLPVSPVPPQTDPGLPLADLELPLPNPEPSLAGSEPSHADLEPPLAKPGASLDELESPLAHEDSLSTDDESSEDARDTVPQLHVRPPTARFGRREGQLVEYLKQECQKPWDVVMHYFPGRKLANVQYYYYKYLLKLGVERRPYTHPITGRSAMFHFVEAILPRPVRPKLAGRPSLADLEALLDFMTKNPPNLCSTEQQQAYRGPYPLLSLAAQSALPSAEILESSSLSELGQKDITSTVAIEAGIPSPFANVESVSAPSQVVPLPSGEDLSDPSSGSESEEGLDIDLCSLQPPSTSELASQAVQHVDVSHAFGTRWFAQRDSRCSLSELVLDRSFELGPLIAAARKHREGQSPIFWAPPLQPDSSPDARVAVSPSLRSSALPDDIDGQSSTTRRASVQYDSERGSPSCDSESSRLSTPELTSAPASLTTSTSPVVPPESSRPTSVETTAKTVADIEETVFECPRSKERPPDAPKFSETMDLDLLPVNQSDSETSHTDESTFLLPDPTQADPPTPRSSPSPANDRIQRTRPIRRKTARAATRAAPARLAAPRTSARSVQSSRLKKTARSKGVGKTAGASSPLRPAKSVSRMRLADLDSEDSEDELAL